MFVYTIQTSKSSIIGSAESHIPFNKEYFKITLLLQQTQEKSSAKMLKNQ